MKPETLKEVTEMFRELRLLAYSLDEELRTPVIEYIEDVKVKWLSSKIEEQARRINEFLNR